MAVDRRIDSRDQGWIVRRISSVWPGGLTQMLNLDPAKLLVIAVVVVILLGPDRLPQAARQIGATWRTVNQVGRRMETEVRKSIPDLPAGTEIARLARSPAALLDHFSHMSLDPEAGDAVTRVSTDTGGSNEPSRSEEPAPFPADSAPFVPVPQAQNPQSAAAGDGDPSQN